MTLPRQLRTDGSTPIAAPRRLDPVTPKLFSSVARLGDTLPEGGPIGLAIYDASGREVFEVVRETKEVGHHLDAWDARDTHGRGLRTGVHFVRLECGDELEARTPFSPDEGLFETRNENKLADPPLEAADYSLSVPQFFPGGWSAYAPPHPD